MISKNGSTESYWLDNYDFQQHQSNTKTVLDFQTLSLNILSCIGNSHASRDTLSKSEDDFESDLSERTLVNAPNTYDVNPENCKKYYTFNQVVDSDMDPTLTEAVNFSAKQFSTAE